MPVKIEITLNEIDLKLISEKLLLKITKYKNKINIEKKIILINYLNFQSRVVTTKSQLILVFINSYRVEIYLP